MSYMYKYRNCLSSWMASHLVSNRVNNGVDIWPLEKHFRDTVSTWGDYNSATNVGSISKQYQQFVKTCSWANYKRKINSLIKSIKLVPQVWYFQTMSQLPPIDFTIWANFSTISSNNLISEPRPSQNYFRLPHTQTSIWIKMMSASKQHLVHLLFRDTV